MQSHRPRTESLFRDIYPCANSKSLLLGKSRDTSARDILSMDTAKKLKTARKAAGFTQADVAREFGISREAVAQWEMEGEKGTRPDIRKLRKLAEVYKISVGELLDEVDADNLPELTSEQKEILTVMGSIQKEAREALLKIGLYLSGQLPERR